MRNFPALLMILGGVLLTLSGVDCKQWKVPEILPVPAKAGDVVVIVYESSPNDADYNSAVMVLLGQDKYWSTYQSRGLKWTKYDKDADEIGGELRREISGYKVPVLAILEKDGTAVHIQDCPKSTEEIDAVVKKVTGK